MREKQFKQFAKLANQLPIEQKRQLLAILNDSADAFEESASPKSHQPFVLLGSDSIEGLPRIY